MRIHDTDRLDSFRFELTRSYRKIINNVAKRVEQNVARVRFSSNPQFKQAGMDKDPDALLPPVPMVRRMSAITPDQSLETQIEKAEQAKVPGGLRVMLEPASMSDAKYELFEKYQKTIHQDDNVSQRGFFRFLVDNPLIPQEPVPNKPLFGALHQCYYLGDTLIAMAVLDILPRCVSSVYFMYDPDYADWGLGKYSALREIMLTERLSETFDDLHYYYMGYYIHTCPKMTYKATYKPSSLLDPVTYEWHPIEQFIDRLKDQKFVTFADAAVVERLQQRDLQPGTLEVSALSEFDLAKIRILRKNGWEYYGEAAQDLSAEDNTQVREYVATVGMHVAKNMFLYMG